MAKLFVLGSYAQSLLLFRGELLKAMVSQGHEVIACAPDVEDETKRTLEKFGVLVVSIPLNRTGLNPLSDMLTLFALVRIFLRLRPDVVLSYTIKPVVYGSLAARISGVSHSYSMITGLGYSFSNNSLRQRLVGKITRLLYKIALRKNDKVFFQNPDDRLLFQKLRLVENQEQTTLINGSGVNLDYFNVVPLPDRISFLLIARFIKEKGIYEYIEAARIIKHRYPQVSFLLVGWLEQDPAAISEIDLSRWQQEGIINYLGKLEDVRPAIEKSSVYVLPSYYREGTPRSVLEAMSMGRPIITTDSPGCRETVTGGENGFLIPIKNSAALAEVMEQFIIEPKIIGRMGKKSRELAEEKYDVHKVNKVILHTMGLSILH